MFEPDQSGFNGWAVLEDNPRETERKKLQFFPRNVLTEPGSSCLFGSGFVPEKRLFASASACLASTTPAFTTATASAEERDPAGMKAGRSGSRSRSGSESSCVSSEREPTAPGSHTNTGQSPHERTTVHKSVSTFKVNYCKTFA